MAVSIFDRIVDRDAVPPITNEPWTATRLSTKRAIISFFRQWTPKIASLFGNGAKKFSTTVFRIEGIVGRMH
jgi:hypothetical protein